MTQFKVGDRVRQVGDDYWRGVEGVYAGRKPGRYDSSGAWDYFVPDYGSCYSDGKKMPEGLCGKEQGMSIDSFELIQPTQSGPETNNAWNDDGSDCVTSSGWRIRNIAQPEQFAESAKTLPDDLTARMVTLVKAVASNIGATLGHASSIIPASQVAEARAIVAEMGPVDEHEAYAEALLKQQGWHGEPSIGFAAVARMIATAHEDGAHPTTREED